MRLVDLENLTYSKIFVHRILACAHSIVFRISSYLTPTRIQYMYCEELYRIVRKCTCCFSGLQSQENGKHTKTSFSITKSYSINDGWCVLVYPVSDLLFI